MTAASRHASAVRLCNNSPAGPVALNHTRRHTPLRLRERPITPHTALQHSFTGSVPARFLAFYRSYDTGTFYRYLARPLHEGYRLLESLLAGGGEVAPPPSPTMDRRREQDVADKYARQVADYEAALRHFRMRISDAAAEGDRLFAFQLQEQCNKLKRPTLERVMRRVEAQPEEEEGYAYGAATAATASARAMAAAGVARAMAAGERQRRRGRRGEGGRDEVGGDEEAQPEGFWSSTACFDMHEEARQDDDMWRARSGVGLRTRPASARDSARPFARSPSLRVALPQSRPPSARLKCEVVENVLERDDARRRARQLLVGQRHLQQIFGGGRDAASATPFLPIEGDVGRWAVASPPSRPPVVTPLGGVRSLPNGEYGRVLTRGPILDPSRAKNKVVRELPADRPWAHVGDEGGWRLMLKAGGVEAKRLRTLDLERMLERYGGAGDRDH